ncbi:MAG: lytic murein transglycosylase, partial [Pseudomonadales bacterium]|nr:lytic murein transglycosylase [Pseudomonadales bacterium]
MRRGWVRGAALLPCLFLGQALQAQEIQIQIAQSEAAFGECVGQLQQRALKENISAAVVETDLAAAKFVPRVIELDRKQPEFSQTFHGYYSLRVTDQRVQLGRQLLAEHGELLNSLTRQYGIPPQYLVSFWGLETNFGRYLGKMNVVDSLATLACDPRRSEFFTQELFNALRLIEAGVGSRETLVGSWAGAMGNMQFMPSAYLQFGLDADKDGRADLWNSLQDAFTSAAHYLQQLGWQKNWRWGREVMLPKGFDYSLAGRDQARALREWRKLGVRDTNNNPIAALDDSAALVIPAGHSGPVFLVYDNFDVIMKWNRSEFYALSVGVLADRINGAGQLVVSPPKLK